MKIEFALALVCAATLHASAQDDLAPPAQELEPVESALIYHSPDYTSKLRTVLYDKARRERTAQFLRQPSFHSETLLTISKDGDKYVAQVLQPAESIWYYKGDLSDLKIEERTKTLPGSFAGRVCRLWHTMLLRTKFQRRNLSLDGISYTFMGNVPGYGMLTAQSSNPESDTKPDALADIGLQIINYVMGAPKIEADILESIRTLENALMNEDPSNNQLQAIDAKASQPDP